MTLQQFASLFNITGIGIVLLVSLVVLRDHKSPFFRYWTWAFGAGFLMMGALELGRLFAFPLPLALVAVAACLGAAWCYWQTCFLLRGRPLPAWTYSLLLGAGLPGAAVALAWGVAFAWVAVLPVLLMAAGFVALGLVLLTRRAMLAADTAWLGWPLVAMGLLTATYPLVEQSPQAWLGYWLSGLLQLVVGVGMVMVVLSETSSQLRRKNEQLEELDRLKGNFLSTVSHELRTPLTNIMGFLELLEDRLGGPLTEQQLEFVAAMKDSTGQLSSLIESVLDLNKMESGLLQVRDEPIDLPLTIAEARDRLGPALSKKNIQLDLAVPTSLPAVAGDPEGVSQVLTNLMSNAIKFTPPGGTVRVEAVPLSAFIEIKVADTGVGIPPDSLQTIFNPFYQVDNTSTRHHGGSGLGLTIVKNLVTAMGGTVRAESRPGAGANFFFTLPIAEEHPARRPVAGAASGRGPRA